MDQTSSEVLRWGTILGLLTKPSHAGSTLDRRESLIAQMAKDVSSTIYYWAWGRGHPARGGTTPLAMIDGGFTAESKASYIEMALSEEVDRIFRAPIAAGLDIQATHVRSEIIDDDTWYVSRMHDWYARHGMDDWLVSIRYCRFDTWVMVLFIRPANLGKFTANDREFVDTLMENVSWLHPDTAESLPPQPFEELTRRQRTILLLLLDGQSRRQIADHLCISENTVNDHAKAIYRHFDVHSITSLAAKMVQGSAEASDQVR